MGIADEIQNEAHESADGSTWGTVADLIRDSSELAALLYREDLLFNQVSMNTEFGVTSALVKPPATEDSAEDDPD